MHAILDSVKRRQHRLTELARKRAYHHPALALAGSWAKVLPGGKLSLATRADEAPTTSDAELSASFTISSLSKDRHGDVVIPKGCLPTLGTYEKNPIVFFNHDSWRFPLGVARSPSGKLVVEVLEDRILSTCFFHEETEEARTTYRLVKKGILRGASIGFRPRKGERIKPREEDESAPRNEVDFENYWYSLIFHEWELVEWSIVGVPANPDAVSLVLSEGKLDGEPIAEPIKRLLEPYRLARRWWDVGGAVRKAVKPMAWLQKTEAEGEGAGAGTGDDADGEGEDANTESEGKEVVQAILCPKDKHASLEDASAYVESLGLDGSDSEDAGDWWAFIQFEPDLCSPETARREDLEDGCQVVLCVRAEESSSRLADEQQGFGEGDETETESETNTGSDDSDSEGKSMSQKKGPCGRCAGAGKGGNTRVVQKKTTTKQDEQPAEGQQQADTTPEPMLPGVALIHAFKAVMDQLAPMQENAAVKKGLQKTSSLWREIASKEYPEVDFGWKDSEDGGDADGGHEEPDGDEKDDEPAEGEEKRKSLVVKLGKRRLGVCKDATEWMGEHAGEENLTKAQRAACKYHHKALTDLIQEIEGEPEEEPAEGEGKQLKQQADGTVSATDLEAMLAQVLQGAKTLDGALYRLTGK